MKARSLARELVLINFTQLTKDTKNIDDIDIVDIILSSIRTLTNKSYEDLKITAEALIKVREFIQDYEIEHPDNLSRPIDAANIPVPIPLTSDMIGRINELIDVADKSFCALEVAEAAALADKNEVKDFVIRLIKTYIQNKNSIYEQIKEYSVDWDIERIVRTDKSILSLAVTELLYLEDIPVSVSANEYIELAKKYCSEESPPFINGIIRGIIDGNQLEVAKQK